MASSERALLMTFHDHHLKSNLQLIDKANRDRIKVKGIAKPAVRVLFCKVNKSADITGSSALFQKW